MRQRAYLILLPMALGAGLVALVPADHAMAAQKPVDLLYELQASSGRLEQRSHDRFDLVLRGVEGKMQARSISGRGLPEGQKPLEFRQRGKHYFATWRKSFRGTWRQASVVLDGVEGDNSMALELRRPRHDPQQDKVRFVATVLDRPYGALAESRSQLLPHPRQRFGDASLKVNDGAWNQMIAILYATGDTPSHVCDSGGYAGPSWYCTGSGEGRNTDPYRTIGNWGSTEGGTKFSLTGFKQVIIQPSTGYEITHNAVLKGTNPGGWASAAITINDASYYNSVWGGSQKSSCTVHLVSGADNKLLGQPGGPLKANLTYAGNPLHPYRYILDLRGFLSESFPPPRQCS